MAIVSRLLAPLASAYGLQTLFAAIFVPQQNDKYYDLGGAAGFLSTVFVSLYYPALKLKYWNGVNVPLPPLTSFAPRQLILTAALGIWSARLGSFLAIRAIKAGGDSRFDKIKTKPARFSVAWFLQATWVFVVGLPVYMCNVAPVSIHPALRLRDYAAIGLIATSFAFEVIADAQKSSWKARKDNKEHDERFITHGLWSVSRHPNYVGEVGIWTGVWALASTSLQTSYFPRGTVAAAVLSPLLTWYLLRKVSGVPLLEKSGDRKFQDDPRWHQYKKSVPIFWPWVKA